MATTKKTAVKPDPKPIPLEARVIQCITDFTAPHTTQDALDQQAVELLTATLLRTHAEKRYDRVKGFIMQEYSEQVEGVRDQAAKNMQKITDTIVGADWSLVMSANKPSTRCDVQDLRTELVRLGVNVDLIDAAIKKVEKKSTPAFSVVAQRTE